MTTYKSVYPPTFPDSISDSPRTNIIYNISMESSEKDERKKRIIFFKISYPSIYILCFSIRTIGRNIRDMLRNDRSNEFIEDTTFAPLFTIHVIEIFIAIFIIFQE